MVHMTTYEGECLVANVNEGASILINIISIVLCCTHLIAAEPSCGADRWLRLPRNLPMGVRA